jgi:putative transposase
MPDEALDFLSDKVSDSTSGMKRRTNKPPRWKENNSIYFLTFCTYRREKILHRNGIPDVLIEDLKFYSKIIKELIAYTIMPDHIHMLAKVEDVKTLSKFLQTFKTHSSKNIQGLIGKSENPLWQRGTMDHCIRDENDFNSHLTYLFYNSFKHLKITPKDYPYHNFKEMVEKGWMEEDFCVFPEKKEKEFALYETPVESSS